MIRWNLDVWKDQLGDPSLYHVLRDDEGFVVATRADNEPRFRVGPDFFLYPIPARGISFRSAPGEFRFSLHVDNG